MHPTLQFILDRYLSGAHSIYSPSASKMWLTCSGSLVPNVLAPDSISVDTAYGTVAHEMSELWLKTGIKPRHMRGTLQIVEDDETFFIIPVDNEMLDYVQQSVDLCLSLPGEHIVEQRVYFDDLTPIPQQGGTLDHAAIAGDTAWVTDHKYGAGVKVYAERNPQAMLYSYALIKSLPDIRRVIIRINQPRLHHFDEWETTRDEIMQFAGYVRERAKLAWAVDAPRTPDPEACRFCAIQRTCPAYAQMMFDMTAAQTGQAFDVADMQAFKDDLDSGLFAPATVDPLALDTAQLASLKPFKPMVLKFWNTIDHELMKRAKHGEEVPGYKIVEGRSFRDYVNRDQAIEHLVDCGIPREEVLIQSVISPAEAEKKLVKAGHRRKDLPDLLGGITKKPPGKPTLVPLADKRPALVDLTSIAFGDLEDENPETEEL